MAATGLGSDAEWRNDAVGQEGRGAGQRSVFISLHVPDNICYQIS